MHLQDFKALVQKGQAQDLYCHGGGEAQKHIQDFKGSVLCQKC